VCEKILLTSHAPPQSISLPTHLSVNLPEQYRSVCIHTIESKDKTKQQKHKNASTQEKNSRGSLKREQLALRREVLKSDYERGGDQQQIDADACNLARLLGSLKASYGKFLAGRGKICRSLAKPTCLGIEI
jgi:hypothetical protein